MVVNSALELAPHDPEFRKVIAGALRRIERFFFGCAEKGQVDGTITRSRSADALAQHLLSVLMGIRVLARARPERTLLEGAIGMALTLLDDHGIVEQRVL
jgi:TetR/AcrR family transcriptional regulator, transcriptional repressor for nem operon